MKIFSYLSALIGAPFFAAAEMTRELNRVSTLQNQLDLTKRALGQIANRESISEVRKIANNTLEELKNGR